jgi:hypothetical protein
MDIEIHEDVTYTLRDLEPGEHYVRAATFRKLGPRGIVNFVRVKTEDDFWSLTLWRSKVQAAPSDKVHRVTVIHVK